MNRAAFLDRDGVINRKASEGDYITSWESMKFLSGASEGIAALHDHGFRVIVISNQRCVAKGLISIEGLEALHARMIAELRARGAMIDGIYYCPHDYESNCVCRKPNPGMLLCAAREHSIDMSRSWMIGDSDIDIEAGKRAGCRTVRISEDSYTSSVSADLQARSLLEASRQILETDLTARESVVSR